MSARCFASSCDAHAPFGYSEPGPRSERTSHGVLRACAAHRAEAEARWAKAYPRTAALLGIGVAEEQPRRAADLPKPARIMRDPMQDIRQAGLFG